MKIPMDDVVQAIAADECLGFCLECGEEAHGVEPDACEYECELCGAMRVYGAEEILLMGEVSE